MSAKQNVSTTLTCDVGGCGNHVTLAGEPPAARGRAATWGWTSRTTDDADWCGDHPPVAGEQP